MDRDSKSTLKERCELRRLLLLVTVLLTVTLAAPAAASAWSLSSNPSAGFVGNNAFYMYAAGSGGSPTTGTTAWKNFSIRSSDYPTSHLNVSQTTTPAASWFQRQWSDGATLGTTEKIDNDSDLRARANVTTAMAAGTYTTNFRVSHTNANPTTYDMPVNLVVEPYNQCTDRQDNDGDGLRDYRTVPGTTISVDPDCTGVNDTTEGFGGTVPTAPSGLGATAVSSSQINLAWTDNSSNESGFELQRDTNSSFTSPTTVITTVENVQSYNNGSLSPNTTYYYRVRAVNGSGNSSYSATASATTAQAPPATPSNVTCVWKDGQFVVNWSDNANNETDQTVHTQTTSGGLGQDLAVGANTTTKTVTTNVTNGVQFDAWVISSNSSGGSSSAQTSFCRGMPLAKPGSVDAVSVDTDTINVTWTDITGETGYTLQRDTASTFASPTDVTLAANATSYTDNTVNGNGSTTYYYRLKPVRSGQATDVISDFDGTTPPPPDTGVSPTAPLAINGVADSSTAITATWDDNATTETGYEVQIDSNSGFTSPTSATKAVNATTHQFTGLTASTAYYLRVRAKCSSGCVDSAWTTITSPVSTPATPVAPTAPSGLSATATSTSEISVGWNDNSNNETGFELQRATNSSFTSPTTISKGAGATTHSDTGLTANTQYFYRVRAVNATGNSAYTATANATTQTSGATWDVPTNAMGQWYWQLQGALDETNNARAGGVNVIDVDAENVTAAEITAWRAHRTAAGATSTYAVCYVSAGTAENFRADFDELQAIDAARKAAGDSNGIMGAELPEWPGEFWLDGQDFQYFDHIIQARVDNCVADGFDAIEFDNMDGYQNDPNTLTASEQLTYNDALADMAHASGMGVGLKNDVDQLTALQPSFDFAINEQCHEFSECGGYSVFLNAGKPVYQAEYQANTPGCASAITAGRKAAYYALALSATSRYVKC